MYRFLRSNGVSLFFGPAVVYLPLSCVCNSFVLLKMLGNLELGVSFELLNLLLVLLEVLEEVVHIFLHLTHLGSAVFHFDL